MVVERRSELWMLANDVLERVEVDRMIQERRVVRLLVEGHPLVPVREVRERRDEEQDVGGRTCRRVDEERHAIAQVRSRESDRIDPALELRRKVDLERGLPAALVDVVVMEVDPVVLLRGTLVVELRARPPRA